MGEREYKIRTREGYFDFDNLSKNKIYIKDIANALSKINRFTGHTNRPYSVAQHSLFVFMMMKTAGVDKETCLLGLVHDFHEAYFSDMSSPLKWFLKDKYGFDANEYCDKIDDAIYSGLIIEPPTEEQHKIIKHWDNMAYEIERVFLFDNIDVKEANAADYNVRMFKDKILGAEKGSIGWANELILTYRRQRKSEVRLIDEVMPKIVANSASSWNSSTTGGDSYIRDTLDRMMHRVENGEAEEVQDDDLLVEVAPEVVYEKSEDKPLDNDILAKLFGYVLWGKK